MSQMWKITGTTRPCASPVSNFHRKYSSSSSLARRKLQSSSYIYSRIFFIPEKEVNELMEELFDTVRDDYIFSISLFCFSPRLLNEQRVSVFIVSGWIRGSGWGRPWGGGGKGGRRHSPARATQYSGNNSVRLSKRINVHDIIIMTIMPMNKVESHDNFDKSECVCVCRYEDPLADILNQRYRTVKEQLDAIRKRKALLESKGVSVPPKRPSNPTSLYLSPAQKLRLQQHMQQVSKYKRSKFCFQNISGARTAVGTVNTHFKNNSMYSKPTVP